MRRLIFSFLLILALVMPVSASARYAVLTFDDGPSGKYTRRLLDGLREREVKATFLLCGYRIRQYPQEAERILLEGHEVGNHGFSHKNMQLLSHRDIAREIMDTQALLGNAPVSFLRPPGGCCSEAVCSIAKARKLALLGWSVDPRDWDTKDAAQIRAAVTEQVHDGDIILLHDMSDSSVDAALGIIDDLTARGFRFVTASQLADLRGISLKPGKRYSSFPPGNPPNTQTAKGSAG